MSTRTATASSTAASTASRPLRPPGTVVSDRGNLLSPMPAAAILEGPDYAYSPVDCMSLPKPIAYGLATAPAPAPASALASDPRTPETFSQGTQLSVVLHQPLAIAAGTRKPGRKPKGQLRSNKSSFVSRGVVFDAFPKRLGNVRRPDELSRCIVVANFERSLKLLDFAAPTPQAKVEPLAKTFLAKAWPLCHEINQTTVGMQQIDLIVGTSAGDLLWIELTSQRYARINKFGNVTHAPVTAVAWLPNSESMIVAAHANGLVVVYDVQAEDSPDMAAPHSLYHQRLTTQLQQLQTATKTAKASQVLLSLSESDANNLKQTVKAVYRLSNANQHITKLMFLGPSKLLVAAKDDYAKIFDLELETTTALIPAYYGDLYACALSPDSKFLAFGGQDDLISIFDIAHSVVVARLAGHTAWITSIAFDSYSDDRSSYKLASVGQDGQVCVWDFSPNISSAQRRHSMLQLVPDTRYGITDHKLGGTSTVVYARKPQYNATQAFPSAQTRPFLPEFGEAGLTDVKFTDTQLLVASIDGRIYTWDKLRT